MAELSIDRLTLKLPDFSEHEARRLASLVAEGLAGAPRPAGPSRSVERLPVEVTGSRDESTDRLAQQIIAEILRQLERET
jgi:hypothetical protein